MAWDWPDSLDALAAAPAFHRLVLETDDVRVIETVIAAGETVPLHTHRVAQRHLRGGQRRRGSARPRRGCPHRLAHRRRAAGGWYRGPGPRPMPPHTVENVGGTEIRLVIVELKRG